MIMKEDLNILEQTAQNEYKYGFVTDIDTDVIPKGLNESVIELISKKRTSRNGCCNGA
ncbi:FeS assembly protein SufB [Pedobacter sp. BAL39]|nr:FeS assembly protein SufB [Pedobacter sp. BAL39]